MIKIGDFIQRFPMLFPEQAKNAPWEITGQLPEFIRLLQQTLDDQYIINNEIAIHQSAVIEQGVVLKAPIIIGPNSFVGAHAYLRGGVSAARGLRLPYAQSPAAALVSSRSAMRDRCYQAQLA